MGKSILIQFEKYKSYDLACELIEYFRTERPIQDVAELARILACSGKVLDKDENAADIPSTGGPSSLSTLLCPLYLAQNGLQVRKLGVPGRPAGGIDVLSRIPGYKTSLDSVAFSSKSLASSAYLHFEANGEFAPLDARLFQWRKQHHAVNIPQLAIASLLSKKIAVGVSYVNLDIRMSSFGNFGSTPEQCKKHAFQFCEIADIFGISARAHISDASIPYQPYIGREESLYAIWDVLNERESEWLRNHNSMCIQLCKEVLNMRKEAADCDVFREDYSIFGAKRVFQDNLTAQGSCLRTFNSIGEKRTCVSEYYVRARLSGYISYNLEKMRSVLVSLQNACAIEDSTPYGDPVGLELLVEPGKYVEQHTNVLRIRVRSNNNLDIDVSSAFTIESKPTQRLQDRYSEAI